MNSTNMPEKRKTGGLMGKNLIIFLVLLVVCSLSIWAWFTVGDSAKANGINVRARADGVEVSWDEKNWYKDLTAREKSGVDDETGPSKNVGNPEPLSLITGDGLKFFEPYLNRRTGTVLMNGTVWQGKDIVPSNSEGKYIDVDLYFRGTSERSVYLAADSLVAPKNITGNFSDFGAFSRDYIAAASRVAFLDAKKQNVSFIWAPNADVELVYDESGYTRVTNTETAGGGASAGDLGDVIDFTTENGSYYLWIPDNYSSDPNTQASNLTSKKMDFTVYDRANNTGLYTCEYTITEPNTGSNPTIIYYINRSGTSWNSNDISYVDVSNSKANNDTKDSYPKVALADTFNLTGQDRKAPAFYIDGFKTQKITITIGYNPVTREVVVVGYSSSGAQTKTYNRAGEATAEVTYYELEHNTQCALVSPKASVAASSGEHFMKAVRFTDSAKNNISPLSITSAERFIVEKTGDGYEATYKFKNAGTNSYLSVANGVISLNATGSTFTLMADDNFVGPVLKSGNYYLVVDGGSVKSVTADKLDVSGAVTVYTGSTNKVNTKVDDSQTYQYYDAEADELKSLGNSTTPKLYTSVQNWSENDLIKNAATTKVCDTKIATLTKANEEDEYYTAHIVMRIWVEGTDREAKTPLADGIFDLMLHFTSQ